MDNLHSTTNNRHKQNNICKKYRQYKPRIRSTRVASLTVTNIDKTQPTVTFGTNGNTSYKKSQSTTVTVTNAGTSTVNASSLKYQWTQSTTAPAESSFTATFTSGGTITKSDGTGNNWYLWILAKNIAGNTTIVKSNVFYLDNTAPNTTAPTATSTTNSIVVTSAQTDAHSGINTSTRQYSIKKKSDSSWGSWITDSSNTHTFTKLNIKHRISSKNPSKRRIKKEYVLVGYSFGGGLAVISGRGGGWGRGGGEVGNGCSIRKQKQ